MTDMWVHWKIYGTFLLLTASDVSLQYDRAIYEGHGRTGENDRNHRIKEYLTKIEGSFGQTPQWLVKGLVDKRN